MQGDGAMKRLLVVSNEPFSAGSSNGRTLMNLLQGYDKAALGQFYLHGKPDMAFCERYFCVSDADALHAFLHGKPRQLRFASVVGRSGSNGQRTGLQIRRSCRNLLLRDLVWMQFSWWKKEFDDFLTGFSPQVVLLQAGDAPFLFAIARRIAETFRVPLVMYNSESYVLKRYMYSGARRDGLWHSLLKWRLKREYSRFMERADFCIYSMEQLEADCQKAYPHPGKSAVVYTVSGLRPGLRREVDGGFRLVYCGNLGVGRVPPLAELARVLHTVDAEAVLEIYGRFVSPEEERYLCSVPGVSYRGVVDYSEVPEILRQADMIVHCENKERLLNLRTAFSTKIADSLAVGTPFLVFADKEYPFVKYLLHNRCAHVASDAEELKTVLTQCRMDPGYRLQFVENALMTAERNHSAQNNCKKFNSIIEAVCGGTEKS